MKTNTEASVQPEVVKLVCFGVLKDLRPVFLRQNREANKEAQGDNDREDYAPAFPLVS